MRKTLLERRAYGRKNAREWRLTHPEQRYATNKKWSEDNPEKIRASQAKYVQANAEKVRASKRRWKETHPEAVQADKEKRRAMVMNAPGDGVTGDQWKGLMREYNWKCVYCGKGGRLTMDHIVPLISGGAHDVSNVVPACLDCNCKKNVKPLIVFMYERRCANATQ